MSEIKEVNEAIAKVAENNANAALQHSEATKAELMAIIKGLEGLVITHNDQISQLQHKYNLLLTKNFNGGSTAL